MDARARKIPDLKITLIAIKHRETAFQADDGYQGASVEGSGLDFMIERGMPRGKTKHSVRIVSNAAENSVYKVNTRAYVTRTKATIRDCA